MINVQAPRDLGDGLVLRRSTRADAAALAEFNSMVHRDPGVEAPELNVAAWTRDLLERPHPTFHEDDFTIVAEAATGRIVSSCNLISQTWQYAGVPFKVGRPELVGTLPEYRKRGLVRAQFDLLHAISAARGELVQGITGIPYYYRQFGYEMAVDLGGGRIGSVGGVPKLKAGEADPYRLRPATEADLPLFVAADARARQASLLTCPYDEALWRYELTGKSAENCDRLDFFVLETVPSETTPGAARGVGIVGMNHTLWDTRLGVPYVELAPGVSWLMAAPSILRGVWAAGQAKAVAGGKTLESVQYGLGSDHPLYRVNRERLPHVRRPYAWYLRVPDLVAFIRTLTPVLENRLAGSLAAGHTGELKLSFFRSGLRLRFDEGRIREVENWSPDHTFHVSYPGLTFLQVLFGYRSTDDLRGLFADCLYNAEEGVALVDVLFPKQGSHFRALT